MLAKLGLQLLAVLEPLSFCSWSSLRLGASAIVLNARVSLTTPALPLRGATTGRRRRDGSRRPRRRRPAARSTARGARRRGRSGRRRQRARRRRARSRGRTAGRRTSSCLGARILRLEERVEQPADLVGPLLALGGDDHARAARGRACDADRRNRVVADVFVDQRRDLLRAATLCGTGRPRRSNAASRAGSSSRARERLEEAVLPREGEALQAGLEVDDELLERERGGGDVLARVSELVASASRRRAGRAAKAATISARMALASIIRPASELPKSRGLVAMPLAACARMRRRSDSPRLEQLVDDRLQLVRIERLREEALRAWASSASC